MENVFDLELYFTQWFGLGEKPKIPKMKKKPLIVGAIIVIAGIALGAILSPVIMLIAIIGAILIAIPVIKHSKAKAKANQWQKNYDERRNTWDAEFDKFYEKTVESMNTKQAAMEKLGIDEDEVKEVKPIYIYGRLPREGFFRTGVDGIRRTDANHVSWLFFGADQLYLYTVQFYLRNKTKPKESTQEFFYTDIVSVSTISTTDTVEAKKAVDDDSGETQININEEYFKLVVPGDVIELSLASTDDIGRPIQALKNKIREKKNR